MTSPMIDTHVHLTWKTFTGEEEAIVQRAMDAGVMRLVDLGTDLESSRRARANAHRFPGVFFAAGIHPNDVEKSDEEDLDSIRELLSDTKAVALGEIGLDFYRDFTNPDLQIYFLRVQLRMAVELGKPVVLHDRKASEELLQILDEESFDGLTGPGGVFHCFAGDDRMAREVIERGFHVSFTGNLTYRNSDRPAVAKVIPPERLLLETDSPFLAPVPHRGRTNEPSYLPYIAAAHASSRGMAIEDIARITTENAIRFLKLPPLTDNAAREESKGKL